MALIKMGNDVYEELDKWKNSLWYIQTHKF